MRGGVTEVSALCETLTWDSAFFGFRIARVREKALMPEHIGQADAWCLQNGTRCLYFLARSDDAETARAAENGGFRRVDTRITFERETTDLPALLPRGSDPTVAIRNADPGDLPSLQTIASESYHDSRFYHDPNFSRHLCDSLYETWIKASCQGYADAVLVADLNEKPVGYVTCHLSPKSREGKIGLVGVSRQARGQGVGGILISKSMEWFRGQGAERVFVVTQGRNVAAQRLYQRCGFLIRSVEHWYHKWYPVSGLPKTGEEYRIPFNRPWLGGKELAYIADVIQKGHAAGDGVYTKKCQGFFEQTFGTPRALLTTSGTHALEMAALLLDIQPADEVIVPSFAFVSTVNAFALRGARPVFADIRPDTLNLDETRLERLITPRTKAIVPVHYAGVGCEMDAILKIAKRHGVAVVEDNAHGLFGRYKGKYLGTFGELAAHSFHETKNVTCGEGGALFVNEPRYVERAEILREKGTDRSRFFRGQVDKYTWVDVGSSYFPSDLLAAFLFAQLEVRQEIWSRRRRIWNYYQEHLQEWAKGCGVRLPLAPAYCEHPFHMFYLILPSPSQRQALIAHLESRGILSVFHYSPLHLSKMGRRFGGREGDCPVTEEVSERLLRLPFYNALTESLQAEVISAVLRFDG